MTFLFFFLLKNRKLFMKTTFNDFKTQPFRNPIFQSVISTLFFFFKNNYLVLAWYCISRVVYLLFSNYYLSWNELVFFLFISFNRKEILDFLLSLLCVSITWHQSTKKHKK